MYKVKIFSVVSIGSYMGRADGGEKKKKHAGTTFQDHNQAVSDLEGQINRFLSEKGDAIEKIDVRYSIENITNNMVVTSAVLVYSE